MGAAAPGSFCWVELATEDGEGAAAFYTGLFDWQTTDQYVTDPEGALVVRYRIHLCGDREVGGSYELLERQRDQGVTPHWLPYVRAEDTRELATKAESLGGNVLMPPIDVFDKMTMAVLRDPTGGRFALWQPLSHPGTVVDTAPGTACWFELRSSDPAPAGTFYSSLLGWDRREQSLGDLDYTVFLSGDRMTAGMRSTEPGPADPASQWLTYFSVRSCDQACTQVESLGGRVLQPSARLADFGRTAVVADSSGAIFSILELE